MKNPNLLLKPRILFLFTLLCAAIASLQSVHAVTVTSTADSGANTLRQALADSNDGDTIDFSVTGTITLSSGSLLVDKNVTISGPGAAVLAVDGNHASRVFFIDVGKTVTISGLTITNGNAGGNSGGGIYNSHSTLTLSNCTVSGNVCGDGGGAVFNDGSFSATSATLTITNSNLSGNSALGGGGVFNDAQNGTATVTISNSTFSGNSATVGGGIYNDSEFVGTATATLIINNSTFSGNSAVNGAGSGGTIYNAVLFNGGPATLTLKDTILNAGSSGENIANSGGTVSSLGYNLSSDDASAYLNQTGDQNSTDPMLGPLQDNGGPTFTHELLTGSPAINAGDPNFTPPPNYDQRGTGYPRVVNGRIDIGAFEVQATAYAAQIQQPINADGTSIFNVRRGVVPVKFTLTLGGQPTCDLPSATIAVYRTGTGGNQQIDEGVYSGPADTGSNFRISNCQYVYNLSASALGAGTYQVDIKINGQVVGSATFGLK